MKKKILLCLAALTAVACLCACGGKNDSVDKKPEQTPTPPPSEEIVEKGDPEFPLNDFGNDNEATYPGAWN